MLVHFDLDAPLPRRMVTGGLVTVMSRRVGKGAVLVAVLTIGCASTGATIEHDDCGPDDPSCHNAAWQQTAAAKAHQAAMRDARRIEDEAWKRKVLAEAKVQSRARAAELARFDAAQWWCFEGKDNTRPFGQCLPSPQECATTRERRISTGLREASECEPYAHAACFNATVSLKKSLGLYCFPQVQLCMHYRDQAIARSLYGVSACGFL